MEQELQKEACQLWVDRWNRIFSFQQRLGFDAIRFETHQAMMDYVFQMSQTGYRIQ